ncbi:uncharacterized protein [Drosophila tropicalis]|uniref:uncharacterized protein n=1 Tax=Drosophila tropicalis TaxID=46794 RepID=UPI0035AC1024
MLKEIILFVHRQTHRFCLARPHPAVIRGGCRTPVKHSVWVNVVFFIAVFAPLYMCLLRDAFGMLRNFNKKDRD